MIGIISIQEEHIGSFYEALSSVAQEKKFLASWEPPDKQMVTDFVLNNIKNNFPQVVAVDGCKVVGWCDLSYSWRPAFKHCGTLGMGVLKEYRGKGIGTLLLKSIIAKAKEQKVERIELEVFSSNKTAIRFYKKTGFRKEGKKIKAAKIENRYEDVIIMSLSV